MCRNNAKSLFWLTTKVIHLRSLVILMVYCFATSSVLAARTQPQMLANTLDNCKRITGYGKHDVPGVAMAYNLSLNEVRYIKAEWGRNQVGGYQCNMVFSTPQGRKSCTLFNIVKDDFIFGQAVTIPGNKAICFNSKP
jgi:hypothetical protein